MPASSLVEKPFTFNILFLKQGPHSIPTRQRAGLVSSGNIKLASRRRKNTRGLIVHPSSPNDDSSPSIFIASMEVNKSFFCFACAVLSAVLTRSVADAREAFTGESDMGRQMPACTMCTSPEYCDRSTCYTDFNTSSLIAIRVNISCPDENDSATVIPPQIKDTVSLEEARQTCREYSLEHAFGCLTSLPVNLCEFPATKVLDVSGNRLTAFPHLSCLTELVTLNLRWNALTSVPREPFVGLTKLRDIFLEGNHITYIHPLAFSTPLPQLNNVMLENNRLESAEMWFLNIQHKFCVFRLSGNRISRFTNEQRVNVKKLPGKIGPGIVDFSSNRIRHAPTAQLAQYGVNSVTNLTIFLDWGFDFRDNPVVCDCEFYDLMNEGMEMLRVIWREYFKVVCDSPPEFRGMEVVQVPLDKLMCNVTERCPGNCTCQDQPSKGYVHVDCNGAGLTSLPDAMPTEKPLKLDLANNSIEVLESRDYMGRIVELDLGHNNLKQVKPETPSLLRNVKRLNLRGNNIAYLPVTLQILSSSAVAVDPYTLSCHCNMTWFSSWKMASNRREETERARRSKSHPLTEGSSDVISCRLHDGSYLPMSEATEDRLSCVGKVTPVPLIVGVAVVAGVVLCGVTLAAVFRFEMLVLCHVLMAVTPKEKTTPASQQSALHAVVIDNDNVDPNGNEELGRKRRAAHGYVYDVFISDTDRNWVVHRLLPGLDRRGVKSYLLARDSPVGVVAVDEAVKRIQESNVVLVVLSAEYAASASCLFQFGQAYNFTLGRSACESVKNTRRKLVVLQVDAGAKFGTVCEPRLKAMLRMKMTHCAENQKDMDRVCRTIESA